MKNLYFFGIALLLAMGMGASPAWAASILDISAANQQETVTITVRNVKPHKVFTLDNPDRLVIDVPSAGRHHVSLPPSYKGRLIKAVRFGQFDPDTSRFVFDLAHAAHVTHIQAVSGKKSRLVVTIAAGEETHPAPRHMQRTVKEEAPKAPQKHAKPLIVIDPGHGGVDPGTIGPDGTQEKDVVLAIAKSVRARLLKGGHYRVLLTRSDDRFIMLRGRVAIARKAGADLFVSLHADSDPESSARGLSVYTVSEQASDKETAALAARENKADVLAGIDLSDERDDVAGILISLAERDTMNRSATLADLLVTSLDDRVRLLPNSHRFAGFAVLKAPDIPSVLIETGFLSHPKEEILLKTNAYREKLAVGIAAAVDRYFKLQREMGER